MKTLRIAIRQQLSALVYLIVLLSLGILAIVQAVVNQNYVLGLRAERLELVAQLKSSQVTQVINFYHAQATSISTRDTIQRAIGRYRAGNHSAQNWESANTSFQVSLNSEDTLIGASIYSLDYTSLLNATNNYTDTDIMESLPDALYPLHKGTEPPSSLSELGGVIMGPWGADQAIVLSLTIPIYNTTSANNTKETSGYLTVIFGAEQLTSIVNDTSTLSEHAQYSLLGTYPVDSTDPQEYTYLLPPTYDTQLFQQVYPFDTNPAAREALLYNITDAIIKSKNAIQNNISVGFSPADALYSTWAITVEVSTADVYGPIHHLRNITLATVFSLAAFMCIITLPIAHFAVRPIVRLRAATEKTTAPPSYTDYESSFDDNSDGNGGGRYFHRRRNNNTGSETDEFRAATFRIPAMVYQKRKPLFTDELTELTTTFNNMTKELRKQYENLEERVRERTKELEAAKIQAEAANEAKSVFIANITHELRTPLNGILGMTAVSLTEKDPHRIRKSLNIIYKSGELLLHLLTDLLIFSRNQLGKMTLDEKEFKMAEIIIQLRAIFEKQASSVKVDLSIDLMPQRIETMVLWGDSNRILQIIINLVSNGLKFTPENGAIHVRIICLGIADGCPTDVKTDSVLTVTARDAMDQESSTNLSEKQASLIRKQEPGDDIELASQRKNSYTPMDSKIISLSEKVCPPSVDNEKIDPTRLSARSQMRPNSPSRINSTSTSPVRMLRSKEPSTKTTKTNNRGSVSLSSSSRWKGSHLAHTQSQSRQNTPESGSRFASPLSGRSLSPFSQSLPSHALPDGNLEGKYLLFEFQVEDNGPGIPDRLQERIFEPFVQGDQALSKKYGGAGLGLSICKQLAELMHGRIEVESVEGIGSTFIFRVRLKYLKDVALSVVEFGPGSLEDPKGDDVKYSNQALSRGGSLAQLGSSSYFLSKNTAHNNQTLAGDDDSSSINSGAPSIRSVSASLKMLTSTTSSGGTHDTTFTPGELTVGLPQLRKIQILVAEDNRVNQQVVLRMLHLEGITSVVIAKDGNEAVDKIKRHIEDGNYFDIVLMDIQMPNLDGLQATRIIREELNYRYPIVALTAYADDSNVKECMDIGMNNFLTKPIKREQLCEILDEYCDSRERNR